MQRGALARLDAKDAAADVEAAMGPNGQRLSPTGWTDGDRDDMVRFLPLPRRLHTGVGRRHAPPRLRDRGHARRGAGSRRRQDRETRPPGALIEATPAPAGPCDHQETPPPLAALLFTSSIVLAACGDSSTADPSVPFGGGGPGSGACVGPTAKLLATEPSDIYSALKVDDSFVYCQGRRRHQGPRRRRRARPAGAGEQGRSPGQRRCRGGRQGGAERAMRHFLFSPRRRACLH
jgi:hypothetical protein